MRHACLSAALATLIATPLAAEPQRVSDRSQFIGLVEGRTLSRFLVELEVTPGGSITGEGFGRDVGGAWSWKDGYFCRTLEWRGGGDPYNCQLVTVEGDRIRFTSDRGRGDSAGFRLQ